MNRAACTIISPNYIAFAHTLAASYLAQHPDGQFFVLVVASTVDPTPFAAERFITVLLHEIGLPNLRAAAMQYDLLELNTSVKPTFLKHLFAAHSIDELIYLDPDTFCYAPFTPVFDALDDGATAILTPHLLTPYFQPGPSLKEQDLLVNGTYNLGFLALRRSSETQNLLDWWEIRCLALGFSEGRSGLFVDQKWMDLAPSLFAGVLILRDPGYNMAYWNLQERAIENMDTVTSPNTSPVPLRFFHFSGIVPADPTILSKHSDRFLLADRPDLQPLFAAYRATVLAHRDPAIEAISYGFDTFSDGTVITPLARRLFAKHQGHFTDPDPFNGASDFARFARRHHLVDGAEFPSIITWKQFDPFDFRVAAVHTLLKLTLRLLGPTRYELLMRYLAHITVLRNQSVFFREPGWSIDEAGKYTAANHGAANPSPANSSIANPSTANPGAGKP